MGQKGPEVNCSRVFGSRNMFRVLAADRSVCRAPFVIHAQTTGLRSSISNRRLVTVKTRSSKGEVDSGALHDIPSRTSPRRRCGLGRAADPRQGPRLRADSGQAAPTILRLERRDIEVNGKTASVYAIRQPNGTFGLTTEVGKPFRVRVENGIGEPSLIHWHGMTPPWRQDGVPGISGPPIPAGGSADYDFPLNFGGTFWMHSHQGLQEQRLMTAPLIIHDERDRADQQEVVVMLADFSFTPSEQILENLKKSGSMAGMGKPAGDHGFHGRDEGGDRRAAKPRPTSTTSNTTPSSPMAARSPIPKSSRSSRAGGCFFASSTVRR